MSAEPAYSVPATPGDATPSLSNQVNAVDFFIKMTMEMQKQLGAMQVEIDNLKKDNSEQKKKLLDSQKQEEVMVQALRESENRMSVLSTKLIETEKTNHQLKTDVQNLTNQVSEARINSDREQEQARTTAQTLKKQIEQATARAAQSERTATEIAAKKQGFFAKIKQNETRLNRLQQSFNSVNTLVVGTKQEITGLTMPNGLFLPVGSDVYNGVLQLTGCRAYTYESKPVYLNAEEQAAFKAMGEALKTDDASVLNTSAASPAKK